MPMILLVIQAGIYFFLEIKGVFHRISGGQRVLVGILPYVLIYLLGITMMHGEGAMVTFITTIYELIGGVIIIFLIPKNREGLFVGHFLGLLIIGVLVTLYYPV